MNHDEAKFILRAYRPGGQDTDDPRFAAGSHCKFCLARATCPTLRRFVLDTAAMEFANA